LQSLIISLRKQSFLRLLLRWGRWLGQGKRVEIGKDKTISNASIIMLTAKATDTDRVIGKVIGANSYITKDYEFQGILSLIQKILQ